MQQWGLVPNYFDLSLSCGGGRFAEHMLMVHGGDNTADVHHDPGGVH